MVGIRVKDSEKASGTMKVFWSGEDQKGSEEKSWFSWIPQGAPCPPWGGGRGGVSPAQAPAAAAGGLDG